MPDVLTELRAFAEDVLATIPTSQSGSNVGEWMRTARHFCDACLIEHRLNPDLQSRIPIREQGPFLDALRAVETASGQYQGQGPDLKKQMETILTSLKQAGGQSPADA